MNVGGKIKRIVFVSACICAAPFIILWFNITHPKAFFKAAKEYFKRDRQ